jgi:hypothetical protein
MKRRRLVPALFLGESAPRLHTPFLDWIPFPGLPKLLLSTTHLVRLDLRRVPHSGYISPEAMVTCLAASIRLEILVIKFESTPCRPDRRRPPVLSCIADGFIIPYARGSEARYTSAILRRVFDLRKVALLKVCYICSPCPYVAINS